MEAIKNIETGMEAVITEGAKGFHVTLRDTDANESVFTTIYPYTLTDAKAKAYAKAQEVLK